MCPKEHQLSITLTENASGDFFSPIQSAPVVLKSGKSKGPVRIAPSPSVGLISGEQNEGTRLERILERKRLEKLEKRKIRKREAAFRSNARKKEQKRIALLACKT